MKKSRVSDENLLNRGVVMDGCKSRSAEEWLNLMQEKSRKQGKALTWYQIKNDPELNHEEIIRVLGRYASFEDKLKVDQSQASVSSAQEQAKAIVVEKKKPKAVAKKDEPQLVQQSKMSQSSKEAQRPICPPKLPKSKTKLELLKPKPEPIQKPKPKAIESTPEDKRLTSFSLPSTGNIAHPGNLIVIDRLNDNNEEEPIEGNEVVILSKPNWLKRNELKSLLMGTSAVVQITSVVIYQRHLELQVERYATGEAMTPINRGKLVLNSAQIVGVNT